MFDDDQDLPDLKPPVPDYEAPVDWKTLPVDVLIRFRDEITQCLPPLTLAEVNVEEEMLLQYHALRALQNQVLNDKGLPLNQRAQIANTVASNLSRMADMQVSLWSSERFKRIEQLLIRHVQSLPEDVCARFLADYREKLTKIG